LEARKKELEAIGQALWRIEHGEYGRYLECEDWICLERLRVRPWAVYCLPCKESWNVLEGSKIRRVDGERTPIFIRLAQKHFWEHNPFPLFPEKSLEIRLIPQINDTIETG